MYYPPHHEATASGHRVPDETNEEDDDDDDDPTVVGHEKKGNILPIHGNASTLNINSLIVTNIQGSPYFKVSLFALKTYHEVIDEIYYKVDHLEPWERGSRKTSGQTGMCGGVRGVGAGGIVSSAYCLLFKLGTLKLTRKQLNGLINHSDSPFIRGLGFMYIRYTQNPNDLWEWFEPYLEDEEIIDVKAGGGKAITIGQMLRSFIERLEWFDTRFPRIPVNTQKYFAQKLMEYFPAGGGNLPSVQSVSDIAASESRDPEDNRHYSKEHSQERNKPNDRRSVEPKRERTHSRERARSRDGRSSRSRDRVKGREKHSNRHGFNPRSRHDERRMKHSKDRRRSRSRDRDHGRYHKTRRDNDRHHQRAPGYEDELKTYSKERKKSKKHKRSRSRSK